MAIRFFVFCEKYGEIEWLGHPSPDFTMTEAACATQGDLTDREWSLIEPFMPGQRSTGPQTQDVASGGDGCNFLSAAVGLPMGIAAARFSTEEHGL